MEEQKNWKAPVYLTGGLVGLVAGLLTAFLYARTAEESSPGEKPGHITTGDVFRIGLAGMALLRQITDLGAHKPTKR